MELASASQNLVPVSDDSSWNGVYNLQETMFDIMYSHCSKGIDGGTRVLQVDVFRRIKVDHIDGRHDDEHAQ